MKNKNLIKIVSIALAVLFTAQACGLGGGGRAGGDAIELTWWKVFDDPRTVAPLIQEFQKQNPKVRVKYVEKDIETYEDELLEALAAGEGPDIFTIHNDWLPKHKNKIAPFPTEVMSLREFGQNFVAVASFDLASEEKIYAIPLAVDVLAMYYNKDILSSAGVVRPPATWEELVNITPSVVRKDSLSNFSRSAAALGTSGNVNRSPDILSLLMMQNGTQFYNDGRTAATIDKAVKDARGESYSPGSRALEFYTQFANPAKTTYNWNARSNNSIEAFSGGSVAMIFSYAYLRGVLAERAPFLNYDAAPVPQIDNQRNKVNFANYWAESVSKQSINQQAAWTFLKFISGSQVLPLYYETQKQVSSRLDIIEKQLSDPEIGVFAESALSAKSFFKPDSDAVESIFVQAIDDVTIRGAAPAEAIKSANQKMNLLLRNF